ncbi:MAG TPA: tetratricopeptide repeat protein [Streptomyces sp.]
MDGGEGDDGAFGAADAPDDDASSGERVHGLVGQGRFAEAHALVGDAFVERNGSAGYLLRAWILAQEKRRPEAREAVDWALALAGPAEAADVFVLAGVVLLSLDESHAALTVAQRAAGADPDGWEPSVLLSDVYRRLGRVPDAVAAARRAVALAPQEAEAQVALARSLTSGRGLLGRVPRRHRPEHQAAVERALMLGADPSQLTAPRGGALAGILAVVVLVGIQLFRIETGDIWQLVATAAGLVVAVAVVVVLLTIAGHRSGTPLRARLRGIRATVRTELDSDPWLRRIREINAVAVLPLVPLVSTALPSDRARQRDPWPLWAVAAVTAAGLAAVVLVALTIRWWYGARFARHALLGNWLGRLQLAAAGLLPATTVAFSATSGTPHTAWVVLTEAHLGWLLLATTATIVVAARAQRERSRAL